MAFQWVFDNAETISMNQKAIVGQTITRNRAVRAVSRGTAPKVFTVKLPDGMRWSDVATYIQALDVADRFTTESITISNSGYNGWMKVTGGPLAGTQTYNVVCVGFPDWVISDRNQVTWTGPFVFYQATV